MSASDTSGDASSAATAPGALSPLSAAAADTLLATMPIGVLALAADGTVTVLNPAAAALWGVPAAAVLGHMPTQVQPAVLPPALVQALAEAAPAAGPYWLPHTQQWISLRTAPAAEGSRWVYWENSPVSPPATPSTPPPAGTLPELEEEYRTLVEGMTQGFCIVEVLFDAAQQPVDYRFLVTNPAFEQQTGLRDAVGHTMRALRPAHEAHWFAQYGQVARTGEPTWFAQVAEQLGRFYEVYAFRVGNPAEHKVAILFCDISEFRQTEQALHESEASYRTLFNSIDEGYFLCDVLFDQQGVPVDMLYLDANLAATRMVGADFRGKRLREVAPTYETYWFEIFGRVARTGVGERLERYAEPDKKWYNFYISKVGDETSHRVAVVFQDITERKQHEQALQASEAQVAADLVGMRRLYELQAKLADQDDVQAALQDVLAAACEFTGTDRGCVQMLSCDGERLEMAVWQGYPDDSPFISFFRYQGLETGCEITRVQRQRLIIEDTVGFEGLAGTEAGAATYADGIRATQSTPLTSRSQETLGVISTQFRQPHRPSDHALQLLDMLAWTAAEFLERHRAEAARRESEQQFRVMADAVPQIIWLTDTEGRVEFFNQQWSDYTGVPYEPTTAAEVAASFVHPDDGAATMAAFTEARATGTTFLVEHRIRSKAGDYRWFLVRAEPYRDADTGEIIRWFWALVDIHDRKQAEAALRASEALLQRAFAIDTVGMLFFSLDGRMTNANAAFKRMSGYRRKELLTLDWNVLTPPEFKAVTNHAIQELADRGETAPYEKQLLRPDGSRWWALCAPTRLRGEGNTAECMEFTIDISERKQAEEHLQAFTTSLEQLVARRTQELQASHERLHTIFEAVPLQLGYYEAVRDDQSQLVDLRAVTINHASVDKMELPDNAPGQLMSAQLPGLQALPVWHTMTQVIDTGQPQRLELRHEFGARTVWFDVLYTRLSDGIISASLDITARKQIEQQLRDNQELLQSIFDTSLISMSVLKAVRDESGAIQDFRIVLVNKELERETGRTDLVGKLYTQEYPGIKLVALYALMLNVMQTGQPAGMEYYYGYEGFDKWYDCRFVKMDDGLVATNLDITERKLAEEKIKEQTHFIARVNETIPDLLTVTELPLGQVLYVNQDPYEAPGFEREKLLNIPLQDQTDLLQMHPDDAALLPDYFVRAAALADHEIATYSYRARFDTDQWRSFQVRGSVFQRDPATGAATQVLSVAQDVTSQREAELQQAKSYQLLQQSEEIASLGSWDYDRTTGEFQWSAGMYRLFELAPGSPIRPATYLDFAISEDRRVAERIVQGLTTGRSGFEETLRLQVGEAVKTVRVKAAVVLDAASEPVRVLGVDLDISEVQRLEAENLHMRLTQQQALFGAVLEAQETERRRMAESLHNGLGQTLYATKLQLSQLQASPSPTVLARANQLLADAIRQTRTLSHELVPLVLTEFGLQAALQDICHTLRNPSLQFECSVELDMQHPLSQPLQIAVYRMAQELVQNVVKHAQATEASLDVETVPGYVLLRVEDNGQGFDPTLPAPAGIGLRSIRDQVALLGGTIEMGASPVFGTYVRLRLPLPPAASLPA